MPADLLNLKVLVPRIQRALGDTTLTDAAATAAAADALARIILYVGDFFGHTLEIVERDDVTGAPTEWKTNTELTPQETEVIAIQAALDHIGQSTSEIIVQTVRSESREFTWKKSATALTERFKALIAERDRALEAVEDAGGANLVYYVDVLRERDRQALIGLDEYTRGPWPYGPWPPPNSAPWPALSG